MDTITHGIAGALLGKAAFGGGDLIAPREESRRRLVTWSVFLGSLFPDVDIFRDFFSHDQLLMVTWHRSLTHSLLLLPLWACLLAALTQWLARRRNWDAPSYPVLCALWAAGILSHILLDLVTTFGTMIWSPLNWSRPAWDILFILDFTFSAILVAPQLLAWALEDPDRAPSRSIVLALISAAGTFLVGRIGAFVGAPISATALLIAAVVLMAIFLVPGLSQWGPRIPYAAWNRAGLALACAYLLAASFAHRAALHRVQEFAAAQNIHADALGALPFPPSLWHWDGLIRSSHGVYEFRMDLSRPDPLAAASASASSSEAIERTYYPDAFSNAFIEEAYRLPEVQKVLWFARFPVTRFRKEGNVAVVEFSDMRFPAIRPGRAASFTYQVRFAADGAVLSQGWLR